MLENKSLVETIRTFFCTCPFLKDGAIHVDYLGTRPTEYSIDAVPAKKELKSYIDGSALCQFNFTFSSVEEYGADLNGNLANSGFYENFSFWLKGKSEAGELPPLGGERQAVRMETEGNGFIFDVRENTARYQIQCRLIYFQGGEKSK